MTAWLLSIIGVVFLSIIIDIIYPDGQISGFCKSMFGIFAVVVMISPIFKIDLNKVVDTSTEQNFYQNVKNATDESYILKLTSALKDNGILGVDVEIDSTMVDYKYSIENIYIDTTNLVLTENVTNINKYEVIGDLVHSLTEIDWDRIVVYG